MKKTVIAGNDYLENIVCKLDVQSFSSYKIRDYLGELGYIINRKTIWNFLNLQTFQHIVQKHRQKYLNDPLAVAIANKRVRLEDLNKERLAILRSLDARKDRKGIIPTKGWTRYTTLLKRLIEIEIAGRDEIEKKPDMVAFFQRIGPYAETNDAELRSELGEIDQQLLIIRGKVPSKAQVRDKEGVKVEDKGQST